MSDEMNRDQEQFDAWIKKVAPTLNAPGAVPRAEMWAKIAENRTAAATSVVGSGRVRSSGPLRTTLNWALPLAAALILGIAIDRMVLRKSVDKTTPQVASTPTPTPSPAAQAATSNRLYRLAATQTLTQAEALLTSYTSQDAAHRDPAAMQQLGKWGRDVLSSTRLLMDSPAGGDPQLRALFEDLELVLVQIIQISGGPLDPSDRALIDRALESKDLLPRIRTQII